MIEYLEELKSKLIRINISYVMTSSDYVVHDLKKLNLFRGWG